MIGSLPKFLTVGGEDYEINSDFRAALAIFEAFNDNELSAFNKALTMLEVLYDFDIPADTQEAQRQAVWFLDVGRQNAAKGDGSAPKTLDWAQDEQLIFAAVNAVTGYDVRETEYMHWWTFYGYAQSIAPDSLISHICGIRDKLARGTKLEKHEQRFYRENSHLVDFQADSDEIDDLMRALRGD